MLRLLYTLLAFSFFGSLYAQSNPAWMQKISPSLIEQSRDGQSVPFIIIMAEQADLSDARQLQTKDQKAFYVYQALMEVSQGSQKDLKAFLDHYEILYQSFFIINSIRASGTKDLILTLAQRPDVARIIDEPLVSFPEPFDISHSDQSQRSLIEWGIERINADDVWALGYRGQGVVVGGEDTGYQWDHPALKNQYRGYNATADTADHNYNWHDAIHNISPLSPDSINPCGLDSKVPCDDGGHGTHTMGTMVGLDSTNEIGVAPEAKWCGCRNMERGWGTPFTYIECFQWFLAPTDLNNENPDPSKAPHVINNSWSCPKLEGCDSSNWEVMNQVVNILRLAGIVVVVSAGNSGPGCGTVSTPAAMFEGSFSVGATAFNDTIAGFSSRGPVVVDSSFRLKPNVAAPGVNIRSARLGGDYVHFSGTSMAGPHVTGLVALMISANPALAGKVDIIEDIIEQTAVDKTTDQMCGDVSGGQIPNNTYGYGRIDAEAAVEAALALIEVNTEDEANILKASVFPNPTTDKLFFEINLSSADVMIELYDIHGRKIIFRKANMDNGRLISIDLNSYPSGIYFYRIMQGENLKLGKVIKN